MTTPDQEDEKRSIRPSGLFRLARFLLLACLFLITLVCIAAGLLDIAGSNRLATAQKAAVDRGLALSMADLFAGLPDIPDSENAALIYLDAFAMFDAVGTNPESPYVPLVSRHLESYKPEDKKLAEAKETYDQMGRDARTPLLDYMLEGSIVYVANRAEVLDLLHQAASLDKSRYPLDWQGFQTPLPHLSKARASARLLGVAAYVDVEEGRPADAASRVHDSLALARSLQGEPMLISSLVEMAMVSITVSNLQRVVSRTDLSDDDLLSLQDDFRRTLATFSCRPGFEGEFANLLDFYDGLISGRMSLATVRSLGSGSVTSPPDQPHLAERMLTIPLRGYLRADEAMAVRYYLRIFDNIDNPSPEYLTSPDPVLDEIDNSKFLLCRMLVPAVSRAVMQAELARARLRAVIAGLAALRHYKDHGSWPDSLETLVPVYLDSVPIDPFTAKPLIYVIKDDGIIIYGVGANAIDDGEGYYAEPPEGTERKGDDVGFRIWK